MWIWALLVTGACAVGIWMTDRASKAEEIKEIEDYANTTEE